MKKLYSASLEKPEESFGETSFIFFEDRELTIMGSVTWSSDLKVNKINFIPKSKHFDDNFQIIDINPCKLPGSNKDFFIVHIWRSKNAKDKIPYTSLASDDLKGFELKYEFDSELFLFNIFETDKAPIIDNEKQCIFTGAVPETKDGSIIVSVGP